MFKTADGTYKVVADLRAVPEEYRTQARCEVIPGKPQQTLADPEQIRLYGNVRKENISSLLGRVDLRWPRTVEKLFGRTPIVAVTDAFRTASRALKHGSFPYAARTMDIDWSIIFLDESLPTSQIPAYLVSNCHPAWMTPPSNIYVVGQRVAVGCSNTHASKKSVADSELVRVMLHEIGHAIEYQIAPQGLPRESFRSEGFAAWFEAYAADFSSKIKPGKIRMAQLALAQKVHQGIQGDYLFKGSGSDYAYAASYFHFIVLKRNIAGLMDVYQGVQKKPQHFLTAIDQTFSWNSQQRSKYFEQFLK